MNLQPKPNPTEFGSIFNFNMMSAILDFGHYLASSGKKNIPRTSSILKMSVTTPSLHSYKIKAVISTWKLPTHKTIFAHY